MKPVIHFLIPLMVASLLIASAYAGNPTLDGRPNDGVADLIVNLADGTAVIDTNGLPFNAFILLSLGDDGVSSHNGGGGDGYFNFPLPTTFDQHDPGLPASVFATSDADEASVAFFDPAFFPIPIGQFQVGITGVINLGQLYRTIPPNLNEDLDFTYTVNNVAGIFDGTLITIDEPPTEPPIDPIGPIVVSEDGFEMAGDALPLPIVTLDQWYGDVPSNAEPESGIEPQSVEMIPLSSDVSAGSNWHVIEGNRIPSAQDGFPADVTAIVGVRFGEEIRSVDFVTGAMMITGITGIPIPIPNPISIPIDVLAYDVGTRRLGQVQYLSNGRLTNVRPTSVRLTIVPEPSTITLAALALFFLLAHGHRRRA